MPSFSIPLSGLSADSTALNTIANNLSNMNTPGYKAQTTTFSDLLYQNVGSSGSGNPIQVGSGVQVATNTTNFKSGSLSSTGCTSSDVAINGDGFFVLDNKGSQLYTRNGAFTVGPTGILESSGGLAVMGYSATNGVVNTSGALSDITIPTTAIMAPSATTAFSVVQTLNSSDPVGKIATSPVKVYDSLGQSYEATVTYTKTGTNQWSYSITMPDTLNSTPASAATVTDAVTPTSTVSGTNTIYTYKFDSSSGTLPTGVASGTLATVDGGSTLSFGGIPVTIPATGESVSALAGQINALGVAGVSATVSGGVLTVTSPTATAVASSVKQDVAGATINYNFGASGGTLATVNTPGTSLTITGLTSTGASATITAPTVTSGETVATYAAALNSALSTAGIVGVTVSNTGGTLSITGANLSTSGNVVQDPVASSTTTGTLSFDSNGNLISPATNVSGVTFSGLSDGAATLDLNWNLYGTTGSSTVTQTASTSTTGTATQNGYSSGNYKSLSVDSSGVVTAVFSNGKNQAVGQLALATVSNEQGLEAQGATNYAATTASGDAAIGVAGSGGRGVLEDSELEGSNVDISSEFSSLIVAQRAFEANSKAITTFDTVTQEAIGMVK